MTTYVSIPAILPNGAVRRVQHNINNPKKGYYNHLNQYSIRGDFHKIGKEVYFSPDSHYEAKLLMDYVPKGRSPVRKTDPVTGRFTSTDKKEPPMKNIIKTTGTISPKTTRPVLTSAPARKYLSYSRRLSALTRDEPIVVNFPDGYSLKYEYLNTETKTGRLNTTLNGKRIRIYGSIGKDDVFHPDDRSAAIYEKLYNLHSVSPTPAKKPASKPRLTSIQKGVKRMFTAKS